MMDIFGKQPTALQQRDSLGNRTAAWPTTRAQRGKYYLLPDPIHTGDQLVVMTVETWTDFGTQMETMRRGGIEVDKRLQETLAENRTLAAMAGTYKDKLAAVQEVRRKEKTKAAYKSHGVTHDHFS